MTQARPLSHSHDHPQKAGGVFRALPKRVRERFSRSPKPVDHLGGVTPEERLPVRVDHVQFNHPVYHETKDLENWPKAGTSCEDMEIVTG